MGHATVAAPLQYPCRGALAVCVAQPWLRVRREERGWAFASSDLGARAVRPVASVLTRLRGICAASSLPDFAVSAKSDRVMGRLGLGQEALSEGNGSCGASLGVGKGFALTLGRALALGLAFAGVQSLGDVPCTAPDYRHGVSYVEPLHYGPEFRHFDYANPDAPKGGRIRLPQMGTFDNFNAIVEAGRMAAGYGAMGSLVYDTLLEDTIDEPASAYVRLADGVAVEQDYRWVAFRLRAGARWHDGLPITTEDVVFTFDAIREHGSVALRTALADLDRIETFGERELCFVTRPDAEPNPILPFQYGRIAILPKHYWQDPDGGRDITKTTTVPPPGSGPYRLARSDFGRTLTYERVADYWGRSLPVTRGRYNFDVVKFDYFRDENVQLEAHKADVVDVREESISKNWATQYDFPAVRSGLFRAELRYVTRVWGLWWPTFWNLDRPRFRDIRVREALWLLRDFNYINRSYFYSFYDHGVSFFQNSAMAHDGLPSEQELALLEPWREQLPPRVFTAPFRQPEASGYGVNRANIRRALALFDAAGWAPVDGVMRNKETGEAFRIDFIFVSPFGVRSAMPFLAQLKRFGIVTTARAPEVSNWLYRSRTGAFDGNGTNYVPSQMPGLQLRSRFGSAAADVDYGQNWPGIQSPAIDALIEAVVRARTAEELYAATRALDRVLLWSFYFIPGPSAPGMRLAFWDRYGEVPAENLSRIPYLDAWWWDEEKAARVDAGIAALE